jgi:hypothetical protein
MGTRIGGLDMICNMKATKAIGKTSVKLGISTRNGISIRSGFEDLCKSFNCICILILVSLLIFSTFLVAPVYGLDSRDFPDVQRDHWGVLDIDFAAQNGIVNGYVLYDGSKAFMSENSVSKEETMVMIYRALSASNQLKSNEDFSSFYTQEFETNLISLWAQKQIAYFLKYNIITTAELTNFVTDDLVPIKASREEAGVWVARAIDLKLMPAYTLPFNDLNSIFPSNVPYIDFLYRMDIMKGNTEGNFLPKSEIKRVEFAAIANRIYKLKTTNAANLINIDKLSNSLAGTVISVDRPKAIGDGKMSNGKIYLALADGSSKIIQIYPSADIIVNGQVLGKGLADIQVGSRTIISYGAFSTQDELSRDSWKTQVLIQSNQLRFAGTTMEINQLSGALTQLIVKIDSSELMYFMNTSTNIIKAPKIGSMVNFICDGVFIVEIN